MLYNFLSLIRAEHWKRRGQDSADHAGGMSQTLPRQFDQLQEDQLSSQEDRLSLQTPLLRFQTS